MLEFLDLEKANEYIDTFLKDEDVEVLSDDINDSENHYYRKVYYQCGKGYGRLMGKLSLGQVKFNSEKKFAVSKHEFFDFDIAKFKELGCLDDLLK